MMPDITGLYEQDSGGRSRMMLQVVTAGQAIVGWFSVPPQALGQPELVSWPKPDKADPITLYPNRAGSFVVDTRQRLADGSWPMHWDYGEPWAQNTKDPQLLLGTLVNPGVDELATRDGSFLIEDAKEGVVLVRFSRTGRDADRFRRYRMSARPPTVFIEKTPEKARPLLQVEHVQPLPPSWVQSVVDRLTGPTAIRLLGEWYGARGLERRLRRELIANHITIHELAPGQLPDPHREALRARIDAELGTRRLRLYATFTGTEELPFKDWYATVVAEEHSDEKRANSKNPTLIPFDHIDIRPRQARGFAYVMDYDKVSRGLSAGFKGTVAGFSLRIRKLDVEFVLNKDGARVVDSDGVPKLKNPKLLEDPKAGTVLYGAGGDTLVGFFLDGGVGLGMSIDFGLSTSEGMPSAQVARRGGGVLSTITCYSDLNLDAGHFDWLTFRIVAVKGPSGSVGNFVGLDLFSTTFHDFDLQGGRSLTAIVTNRLQPTGPKLPSYDLLGGPKVIKEYIEGWIKGKSSLSLFEISMGFGIAMRIKSGSTRAPDPSPTLVPPSYALQPATASGIVLFDVCRAELRKGADLSRDARYQLEVWIASMRALFTVGPANVFVDGFTSPEASRSYNMALSLARAAVVSQAILDALEGGLTDTQFIKNGHGELPALQDPRSPRLEDPPDDKRGRAAFIRAHPDQVRRWPSWRTVEVVVDGQVLVVGLTAQPAQPVPAP